MMRVSPLVHCSVSLAHIIRNIGDGRADVVSSLTLGLLLQPSEVQSVLRFQASNTL